MLRSCGASPFAADHRVSWSFGGRASYAILRGLAAANPSRVSIVPMLDAGSEFDEAQITRAIRRQFAHTLRLDILAQSRAALHFFRSLEPAIRAHSAAPATSLCTSGLAAGRISLG